MENLIATGGRDGIIKLWENGKLKNEFIVSDGGVCCLSVIK